MTLSTRREFLAQAAAISALACAPAPGRAASGRAPRIILRSSWQVVNIGDIAHTPGVLALLEKYLPEAEVVLWASSDLTTEVIAMETRRFPKLKIVQGHIRNDGTASQPELQEALDWCDFLLHGSGASFVAWKDVLAFDKHFQKPFGVYGITWPGKNPEAAQLLSRAKFAFFRDTVSLTRAKQDGVTCPIMEFGPDGAFACDVRDNASAERFLNEQGLAAGKFMCCIPRFRWTPYWLIKEKHRVKDEQKATRNEEMREHDHAPLREAICALIRETDLNVLICPEDMTQMAIGKENLFDPLPADVRQRVVWRKDFWLTDEALSTYVRSSGLFGLEMHSPIMCIGNGVPALVGRFEEQTSKGFMWRDIGLGDWLFDLDQPPDVARIVPTVLSLARDRTAALEKVKQAQSVVHARQKATMQVLRDCLKLHS